MLERLNHYWRVFATGISFIAFGINGLLLGMVVFPVLGLLIGRRANVMNAARTCIRLTFRVLVKLMQVLGVLHYEIIGLDKLDRSGLLILSNHPTLIDTMFLMAFVKRADCIVKGDLWHNPVTGRAVRAAGYVSNELGIHLIDACIESLRSGSNLIVFPEGTRTAADGVMTLKRGAANIAVRGARDITPVLIRCRPLTLSKGDKWWQVPPRRAHFRIEVKDDIRIDAFRPAGMSPAMAARQLTEYLQHYFTEENGLHA